MLDSLWPEMPQFESQFHAQLICEEHLISVPVSDPSPPQNLHIAAPVAPDTIAAPENEKPAAAILCNKANSPPFTTTPAMVDCQRAAKDPELTPTAAKPNNPRKPMVTGTPTPPAVNMARAHDLVMTNSSWQFVQLKIKHSSAQSSHSSQSMVLHGSTGRGGTSLSPRMCIDVERSNSVTSRIFRTGSMAIPIQLTRITNWPKVLVSTVLCAFQRLNLYSV